MRPLKRAPFFESRLSILLFGILAIFALYGAVHAYVLKRASMKEQQAQRQEIEAREREISELQAKLEHFESGEGLELEARGRLNLQKPGENVLIIVDDRDGEGGQDDAQNGSQSVWRSMKEWLGW